MTNVEKAQALISEIDYASRQAKFHEGKIYVAEATCDEANVKSQTAQLEAYLGRVYRARAAFAELTGKLTCEAGKDYL